MNKPTGSLIAYFNHLVRKQGGINLAQGISGFEPPEELLLLLKEYTLSQKHLHQYPPGNGDFKLLDILASHYSKLGPIFKQIIYLLYRVQQKVYP
jgi:hypothetical protein